MKNAVIALAAFAAVNASFADTYFFVGARGSSWQDRNNYRLASRTGSIPADLPDADDYVLTGAANSLSTNDVEITAEDINFIARLKVIGIRYATLTLNIATNAHLGCAIAGLSDSLGVGRHGEIVKKGAGTLYLDSVGTVLTGGVPADYLTWRFTVKQGAVYAMNVTASYSTGYLGVVNVEDGAAFHLPTYTTSTFHLEGFEGDGDISYGGSLGRLQLYFDGNIKGPHVFNGTLSGNIQLRLQNGVSQTFSGGANTFTGVNSDLVVSAGTSETTTLGFAVGNETRTAAQSLGTYGQMALSQPSGEYAPRLLYTGTGGDTFAKKIVCYSGNAGIIDGGDSGGLTIAGGNNGGVLRYSNNETKNNPGVARLVFRGDGTTENVYDTVLDNRVGQGERGTAAAQPMTIVKKGAGIWKFTARTDHYETGTYAIDEGTLRFGSLAPVGTSCSLGLGTMTYDPDYSYKGSAPDTSRQVGYHIRLGGGTTAGTLEYVGTTDVSNDSRIIAVNGNGTLKNSSGHSFAQYGVVTSGTGDHVLTLDGVTEAGDITNAVGTLSVAVDAGDGTTRLSRNLSFNGELSVSGGHLKIHNPTNYTYFRMVIKENMYDIYGVTASYDNKVCMSEFAMYDDEGRNLTTNLTVVSATVAELGENEACYVQGSDTSASFPLSALFNDVGEPLADGDWRGKSPAASFNPADSSTWLIFAMRLPETGPRVAAFDFISALKGPSTKGGDPKTDSGVHSMYDLAPRAYALEGSMDGVTWHELYSESDHNANHIYYKTYGDNAQIFWASSDGTEAFASGAVRSGVGFAFTSPATVPSESGTALRNVSGVSVASGATLKYVGDVEPVAKITIDATKGFGTLDNATLADSGTVDFVNVPKGDVEILADWSCVNNPSALNGWALTIDGDEPKKRVIVRTASGFKILRKGFVMTFR